MADVVIMPKLGFNMDEGQLVRWCKGVGDDVRKGEVLFEINTDKTTMPVEATMDGVLLKIMAAEGEFLPVFTPIAVIGRTGEDPDAVLAGHVENAEKDGAVSGSASSAHYAESVEPAETVIPAASGPYAPPSSQAAPVANQPALSLSGCKLTPKAKQLIRDKGLDAASLAGIQGTGYDGGITAADIVKATKATPLARTMARTMARAMPRMGGESGVNLAAVTGSGPGGKVMKADVQAFAAAPGHAHGEKRVLATIPYKGTRRIIGERLARSKFTAPHLYFADSVDTTKLAAFRAEYNALSPVTISFSDLLIVVAAKALTEYPGINASLEGDSIRHYASCNIGLAVAGEGGLIVPVVREAQSKSLPAIASETRDLIARARESRLLPEEFSGGTFTISNLGMFGIERFTAIINPPEAAILAVSSTRKKPVVVTVDGEDRIEIRPMMHIQLSVDHRIIDGLLATQFVGRMKHLLENPMLLVM